MILVTDVICEQLPHNFVTACEKVDAEIAEGYDRFDSTAMSKKMAFREVLVKGARFRNPSTKEDIVIGFSPKVTSLLGLSFDVYENQQNEISSLNLEIRTLYGLNNECNGWRSNFNDIEAARWWTRLHWVFTGVKV